MESSWPFSSYDGIYQVTQHMASTQQSEGDCLSNDHFSSLPDRVHLDLKQNDFTDLINIWDKWGATTRANFDRKYGHIARLLKVQMDEQLLKAIVQFWDPSYRCFVFNKVDMVPTIEEYSALIQIDLDNPDKIYWRGQKTGHRRKLAKMMGITPAEVDQNLRKKRDNECIPWSFLRSYIMKHRDTEQGQLVMALEIYGLVIFPKVLGHIEVGIIDFFEQVINKANPSPSILAKTFRSLNYCRRKENRTKEQWISRLRELMSVEVTWRALWMLHHPVLYKCGNEPWVPLMGPWGAISYAPIMVRRQFGSEQFVPMTHRLITLEFAFGEPDFLKKIEEIAQAWKKTSRVDQGRYTDEVTTGYQMWHDQRVKDVVYPKEDALRGPVDPEP
ncbi:PREDICTED: uncharacterized protein LOC108661077 [Theobroma cacao]|uniref:Uncharacterized protein LOC108661077 n=1 Tax=Theobroma cacao TaxID=3641 RepID=A0AB32W3Z3_THECC|nr:PREDICTED: uncharacterized protein LOC108661077 [Theobroma cacao]